MIFAFEQECCFFSFLPHFHFPLDFHHVSRCFPSKHSIAGEMPLESLSGERGVVIFLQVGWHHLKARPRISREMLPLQE